MIDWFYNDFDIAAVQQVKSCFEARSLSMGSKCTQLEREIAAFTNSRYCVVVTSGSVALLVLAYVLGCKESEVIVQARSWIATGNSFKLAGMRVKVVDVDPLGRGIDVDNVIDAVSPNTKIIVATHMNGSLGDIERLEKFCHENSILLIEDAAQALGSMTSNKMAGTFGLAGTYSFSVPKIISGGQGGAIVTNSEDLYVRLLAFRTHGLSSLTDISSWSWPGFNFRYNDIQASIVLEQLHRIEQRIAHLKAVQRLYRDGLASCPIKFLPYVEGQVGPYVEVLVEGNREAFTRYLLGAGVVTRAFYPSLSEALFFDVLDSPNAEQIGRSGVYLPSGPTIPLEAVSDVVTIISRYYGE